MIGTSQVIHDLREEIDRIARSDCKVLITGESGVGKEVVASEIVTAKPARLASVRDRQLRRPARNAPRI